MKSDNGASVTLDKSIESAFSCETSPMLFLSSARDDEGGLNYCVSIDLNGNIKTLCDSSGQSGDVVEVEASEVIKGHAVWVKAYDDFLYEHDELIKKNKSSLLMRLFGW